MNMCLICNIYAHVETIMLCFSRIMGAVILAVGSVLRGTILNYVIFLLAFNIIIIVISRFNSLYKTLLLVQRPPVSHNLYDNY